MTNPKRALCLVMGHDWGPWWNSKRMREALEIKRTCRRCHQVELRELPRRPLRICVGEELLRLLERRVD